MKQFERIHVSQHPSRFNDKASPSNSNCVPTSVLMALRLFEREVPGITDIHVNDAIRRLRLMYTGHSDEQGERSWTFLEWFSPVLYKGRVHCQGLHTDSAPLEAIDDDKAILLRVMGMKDGTWYCRHPKDERAGHHMVLVSGKTPDGKYIINDPMIKQGPIAVLEHEVRRTFCSYPPKHSLYNVLIVSK